MSATSRRNKREGRKTTQRPAKGARCPTCGLRGQVTGDEGLYFCSQCKGLFDGDSGEGGDYSDFNPAARMERAENRRKRYVKRYDARN